MRLSSALSGVLFLSVCLLAVSTPADEPPANVGGFVTELMQIQATPHGLQLGLWLPSEFFMESVFAQGNMTRAQAAEQVKVLKPYLMIGVASVQNDAVGRSTYATEAALRERTRVLTPSGEEIPPLATVPPRIAATLASFKTAFSVAGGAQNENTHFLVFEGADLQGKLIVDPQTKSKLTMVLKKDEHHPEAKFTWFTPFDAITPASPCHKCGEKVSSKWSYCPFCGARNQ